MVLYRPLASLGIGAATVDTQLADSQASAGGEVKGKIVIKGGNVPQQIDHIYLYLVIQYLKNGKKTSHTLEKYQLAQPFVIEPNEKREIPFQIRLPLSTPLSTGSYPIYLKTGLDIKHAIDPSDTDKIEVFPHPLVQKLLKQIEDAQFILYRIYNEYDPTLKAQPFAQIYEFRPTGKYHGYLDVLKVNFHMNETHLVMNIELIRSTQSYMTTMEWQYQGTHQAVYVDNHQTLTDPMDKVQQILTQRLDNQPMRGLLP
ncbi:sporulation protein [Laceyella tengchongensis]|uniref:sporulation protein n=1 Tax=Laceyella tengchongensis TaxID=574699 RepID=UPI0012B94187|nr:sporulation protein SpoOM [Laceyella tengchongensis]